jgi:UDP-2,3-diacylglucosamine hydrolase
VAVKVAKENHDMRWDIPCFGLGTLRTCAQHRIAVLAVQSGKTLLLDPDEVKELARNQGVAVVTVG